LIAGLNTICAAAAVAAESNAAQLERPLSVGVSATSPLSATRISTVAGVGGAVVLLKAPGAEPEVAGAKPLIEALGGRLEACETRRLPTTDRLRLVVVIRKVALCGPEFPRTGRRLGRIPRTAHTAPPR